MLILIFGPHSSEAIETPLNMLQTPAVQKQTVKALQAINQNRWVVGRDMIAQTRDPLASKLYFWLSFTKEQGKPQFTRLAQFIRSNPEWPGMRGLRLQAEEKMPGNLSARDIVTWFDDYTPLTTQGMDRYVQALILKGRSAKAKTLLSNWWSKTLLPREDQRQIYQKYRAYLGPEAHKKRLGTLLYARQYTNARAIAGVLGHGYPALTEARIKLAEEKGNVDAYIRKVPASLQNDPGLLYERLRWRRRHDLNARAIEILRDPPSAEYIQNPKAWWRERHIIIRRLLEKKKYEGAYVLASGHRQKKGLSYAQAEWLSGWLSLRFLDNAPRALQHFEALHSNVKSPISRARAAYWAGRAAKVLKQTEMTQDWFQKASRYQTTFYGQMAGAELGLSSALPHALPPDLTSQDKKHLKERELLQAAQLFHQAGMRNEASDFMQAFVRHEPTAKNYRFVAEMAADMEHYHDAVRIAKQATKKGLFLTAQSYPAIPDKLKKVPLEWALVHALIRQESMFDYKAKSPAGALGLMQLMPATAKGVARQQGLSHRASWLTSNPAYNIRLGSQYLSDMLKRFGGSYPMAIAAYNGGPARVDQWLEVYGDPRIGEIDLIDWLELIPIYETRNYVQRVMEAIYVYRLRLKNIQKKPQEPIHIAMRYKH